MLKNNMRVKTTLKPMLATLTEKSFDSKDFIYEIKWDGYRCLCVIKGGGVDLFSRNGLSFNEKFPKVRLALEKIKRDCILDGEIIAYDENNKVTFQALQNAEVKPTNIEYAVFDILELDGKDITNLPLMDRKSRLKKLIPKKNPTFFLSEHVEEKGTTLFESVVKAGGEGVIAKKKDSQYTYGIRSENWLKFKSVKQDEAIIVGFTKPRGSRQYFGSLVLGQWQDGKFKFIGHSGTGLSEDNLKDLYKKLIKITTKKSPFDKKIPINSPITWVKPKFVASLKFSEWTKDKIMRHPVYLGLREDKEPKEVKKEKIMPKITNPDKIYFPKPGLTKMDLIEYYQMIAPYILPYLVGRPESMLRHPNGVSHPGFFQKDFTEKVPDFAETVKIKSESTGKITNYLLCNNIETLIFMANLGCIELNPWLSRVPTLRNPEFMVIDIDPGNVTWANTIKVTKEIKRVLEKACEKSYVKTSGKRGLHIYIPLKAKYDYTDVHAFVEILARIVQKKYPKLVSLERTPAKRKNMIYIDYLRNTFSQTIAAPYSARPTQEATVSAPIKWNEVSIKLNPKKFTIKTMSARLKKHGDLWNSILTEEVDLKESLTCLIEAEKQI